MGISKIVKVEDYHIVFELKNRSGSLLIKSVFDADITLTLFDRDHWVAVGGSHLRALPDSFFVGTYTVLDCWIAALKKAASLVPENTVEPFDKAVHAQVRSIIHLLVSDGIEHELGEVILDPLLGILDLKGCLANEHLTLFEIVPERAEEQNFTEVRQALEVWVTAFEDINKFCIEHQPR